MLKKEYFSKDIFDFLVVLNKHKVKFVLVGGEAVIYYGHARLTGDIDIYYELTEENIDKLWLALLEFWDKDIPLISSKTEFMRSGLVVQFGLPPNRIDLINSIDGVEFVEVWENKISETLELDNDEKLEVFFIGLIELIKNKKSAGRNKDLEDVKFLEALIEGKK